MEHDATDETDATGGSVNIPPPPPPPPPSPAAPIPEIWQPAPEASPSRAGLVIGIVVVAVVIGFAVTTLALNASSSKTKRASTTPAPTTPTSRPFDVSPDPNGVLGHLIVQQTDVPDGFSVVLIPGGTDAARQTTLDLCNGVYPSERLRTARRQVAVGTPDQVLALSTEAVLYGAPAATTQAFAELRQVTAACPKRPVPSLVGGATVTTTFRAAPDTRWPRVAGVDRLAFEFDTTDANGQHHRSIAVYLRRGRALLAVYFSKYSDPQVIVGGKKTIPDIVRFFEDRLAAAPSRDVGSS